MPETRPVIAAAIALSAAPLFSQSHAEIAARIIREGTTNSQVMRFQDELCHDYGSRLTGSLAFDRAADWAVREFRAMGLEARLVPWGEWKVRWDREQWMGRMVAPSPLELQVACPAWTGGTRGIARGRLLRMPTDEETLDALSQVVLGGGAFWLYGALPRGDLGAQVRALLDRDNVHGIAQSATSTRWNSKSYPNQIRVFGDRTAPLKPFEARQRWAQAVVRDDQCEQLEAALDGGAEVVVEFELRNRWTDGPVTLNNVVADLVGTEFPDEYVVVCAHLDSWHQATGATDNGTGACSTLEAARLITQSGLKPKRTIRFILWGGEEQGLLGSRGYVVQNRTRMHKVSAVFNHDSGTNWAHALTIAESQRDDFERLVAPILAAMKPPEADHEGDVFQLRAVATMKPAGGGSDHASFAAVGVPAYSWSLKGPVPYGRGWHSQWDTYSIVRPDFQRHNATVFAVIAAGVADLDHMLSRDGVERATPGGRRGRVDAKLIVETWLGLELDGLEVKSVTPDGLAGRSDLRADDAVVAVGDEPVENARELLAAFRKQAGEQAVVTLTVRRRGDRLQVSVRP
ncbi:MAG: M20/M25/M40 family metallo-hydrolase [Planctomycetota bacterium]